MDIKSSEENPSAELQSEPAEPDHEVADGKEEAMLPAADDENTVGVADTEEVATDENQVLGAEVQEPAQVSTESTGTAQESTEKIVQEATEGASKESTEKIVQEATEGASKESTTAEDLGKGARRKTPTEKGKGYQLDQLQQKSKSAFLAFNKSISKAHSVMRNPNLHEWKSEKSKVEASFESFTSAHDLFVSAMEEVSEIQQANKFYTQALESYNQTMSVVSNSIKRLEQEESDSISLGGSASTSSRKSSKLKKSSRSVKSTRSHKSNASITQGRSEAAATKAACEAELPFAEVESKLQEQVADQQRKLKAEQARIQEDLEVTQAKLQADLRKLNLQRERAKAKAIENALSQFDDGASSIQEKRLISSTRPASPQVLQERLVTPAPVNVSSSSYISQVAFTQAGAAELQTESSHFHPPTLSPVSSEPPIRYERHTPHYPAPRVILPAEEPPVFDGTSVLDYPVWKGRFKDLIEKHVPEPSRRIGYLMKYTRGEAREAIEGYVIDATNESYFEAMETLEKWYGDQLTITKEYKRRLNNWPIVSTADGGIGFRKFTNYLNSCKRLISSEKHRSSLDDEELNQRLVLKLPKPSREVWARKVHEYKSEEKRKAKETEESGRKEKDPKPSFPPFLMFANFVEQEAFIATQPVVGTAVLDQIVAENKKANSHQARNKNFKAARSFATSTGNQDKDQAPRNENIANSSSSCLCCEQSHGLEQCNKYKGKQYDAKVEFIKENRLCFRCLKPGHISKKCQYPLKCSTCGKNHPTVLHSDRPIAKTRGNHNNGNSSTASQGDPSGSEGKNTLCLMSSTADVIRTTRVIPVYVRHAKNPKKELRVYCALDEQSDSCFVSDEVHETLGIQAPQVTIRISCMGTPSTVTCSKIKDLSVRSYSGKVLKLPPCYSRDSIPVINEQIVSKMIAKEHSSYQEILDEIPEFDPSIKVGLLLGTDCIKAMKPISVISDPDSDSYAIKSVLGWSIVGLPSQANSCDVKFCNQTQSEEVTQSHIDVGNFVPLNQTKELIFASTILESLERDFSEYKSRSNVLPGEVYSSNKPISIEDRKFLQKCQKSIRKTKDGHYELSLPFRNDNPEINDNRPMAVKRMQGVKRRMDRDEMYKKNYFEFVEKLLLKGLAVEVHKDDHGVPGQRWYLIHHGVYHSLKPGKIRVVYDGSAKFQGVSLNELLLTGPCLTNTLIGVLARFRKGFYCWIGDLEQMFYSVYLSPEHQDFFRFLWWKDEDTDKDPVEYKMVVHSFGISSSPGCSIFALKKTAEDNKAEFGEETAKVVSSNSYVDDILVSCDSVEEAVSLAKSSKEMCKKGGFKLTKFAANDSRILNEIPVEERCSEIKDLDIGCDSLPILRTLGVEWSIESDSFIFRITLKVRPFTRRGILATVSSIFDPFGFISVVTLEGKRILQILVKDNKDWDEEIPESLKPRWEKWRSELPELAKLKIRRCFKPEEFGQIKVAELHHFSDASSYAYGQCSYLRLIDDKDRIHCSLVMSKARIAPLRPVTIPRLELTAALVSVRVSAMLQEELEYENLTQTYWTDSKVVLGYISNESKRFHIYVANRVQEIREKSEPQDWFFVGTKNNAADDVSRGLRPRDMTEDCRFFNGPDFLWHRLPQELQDSKDFTDLQDADPEVKKVAALSTKANEQFPSLLERIMGFSRLYKALRFLVILRRTKEYLKAKSKAKNDETKPDFQSTNDILVQELEEAKFCMIKMAQRDVFQEEISALEEIGSPSEESDRELIRRKNSKLKKTSTLFRLHPFLDLQGLLRVGGRLSTSSLPEELKHPIIMPKSHHVTKLLIQDFHEKIHHQGRGITHNAIREAGFWIIGGTSVISSCISECTICRRLRGRVLDQKMADLPPDRSETEPPFTFCGVDLFGPWIIKEGRKELKRYGVLFTCLSSRAVRIEVAPSLETDSFVNALRRFVCRDGPIRQLRCDRGTNLVGASRELHEAFKSMDHKRIQEFLLQENCDYFPFKFNVPSASYQGGVWERQIRSVRAVLSAILLKNGQQLDEDSLRTFMAEAEAVVNCRPLTVDNLTSVDGPLPLTANNVLTGKSRLVLPPPGIFGKPDVYVRKRWRRVQHLANEFWQRWRKEFLQSLQERTKWNTVRRDLKINDIVIVADDNMPRNCWKLGRIEKLYPDEDGHVRKVQCRIADSSLDKQGKRTKDALFLDRPIQKLILFLKSEDSQG